MLEMVLKSIHVLLIGYMSFYSTKCLLIRYGYLFKMKEFNKVKAVVVLIADFILSVLFYLFITAVVEFLIWDIVKIEAVKLGERYNVSTDIMHNTGMLFCYLIMYVILIIMFMIKTKEEKEIMEEVDWSKNE